MAVSWTTRRIVDLCEVHVDCVNRTAPLADHVTPFKMIRTTNVRNGYIDSENVRYVTEETYHRWTRRLVPKRGDIILTREAPLGDVGKIRTDDLLLLGQRLYHFRPHPELLDPDFLLYSLMAPALQAQIKSYGSGSTVEHMRLEDVPELLISVPPIDEQRRIAGILSAYDDLIENCQRRIRILEEMARRLYREWFVHFRYPGHESVPLVDSPLGPIPHGWELKRLGDLALEVRDNIPKGQLEEPAPYVGLEHIPRRSLALDDWETATELGSNKLAFKHGDVLFGKIRPYFHKVSVAPFDGLCSADTIVIRPLKPSHKAIVTAVTSSDQFVAEATASSNGSKMPRANWHIMKTYPVPLPPACLLAKFSAFFQATVSEQQVLIKQSSNLCRTRDLLVPRLLSEPSGEANATKQR